MGAGRLIAISAGVLWCIACSALTGCQRESEAPQAPASAPESADDVALNVVLITLDTTRADALGSYGQRRRITPNLDRLAAEGTQFQQCVSSAPSTLPSHSTLFTGRHPFVHGVRSNAGYVLSDENTTLAEALSAHGYKTSAEIAAPVIGGHTQLGQGFDRFHDLDFPDIQRKTIVVRDGEEQRSVEVDEREADDITNFGLRFIKENRSEKFFLWLHYFDAHQPYSPPGRFYETSSESAYHGEIQYIDEQINRVLAQIEGLGLRERTLVVVVADHGEAMGEHDEKTHMYFVYDGTIRVPLLFWGATVPKGLKIESLVRTVDIAPTILDMLNLPPLEGIQGTSLLPLMRGEALDLELVGYGESIEPHIIFGTSVLRFVRKGQWKYIHKVEPELFDLTADPGELKNLSSVHPEIVERLRAELSRLVEEAPEKVSGARSAIDPATAAQLEALGYMAAAPTQALGDEMELLEVSGVDPAALTHDMDLVSAASGLKLTHRYEESAEKFRAAIARNPDSVPLLMKLDHVLKQLDEDDERFEILTRVIELAPETAPAYANLAHVMFRRGDPAEAERLLSASLSIDPCTASPRATLAYLAAQRNDRGRQLQLLKEGIDQCPREDGILNNYAYALATHPDEKDRDGEEALRIARQISEGGKGERPDFLDTLACAYAEVGDFESAVRAGERALAMQEATGDPKLIEESKAHLEQFRAGRPVREP
ncbi:MAG: sulfatase-like hydrolase/transferase [Deltaproteobacteria bacterium]|nr:sulfatase-like hydrolase/transferase [Deltaproteobacteria bacterium]MBW2576967.1 sulfatase-like hydrolase/transferase [Deltaproteobacteria bacterium]